MFWRKKAEVAREETKHEQCRECGVIGHADNMVAIPISISQHFQNEVLMHRYGSVITFGANTDQHSHCWFCKEHAPLKEREVYGGWEYSEHGQSLIDDALRERTGSIEKEEGQA